MLVTGVLICLPLVSLADNELTSVLIRPRRETSWIFKGKLLVGWSLVRGTATVTSCQHDDCCHARFP